jgi:NADH-quinone oxidoreductase subunit J
MPWELVLFYALAAGAVLSAGAVIRPPLRQPTTMHSALALLTCLFCVAGLYALLAAPLLAALQILIYAGAVVVLIVFVILLLDLGAEAGQEPRFSLRGAAAGLAVLFVLGKLLTAFGAAAAGKLLPALDGVGAAGFGEVAPVGRMLYTTFMVPFELLSVLLLVAIVSAVVLARRGQGKGGET